MLRCAAILMTVLILASSIRDVIICTNFYLNQDYIADVLCVNRDKPELLCSGKCVLVDQLTDSHSDEPSSTSPIKVKRTVYIIPHTYSSVIPDEKVDEERSAHRYVVDFYRHSHHTDVFHPPTVAA